MRILLDTSIFLWFIGGSKKLNAEALKLIENFDNTLFMSIVSLWEIAIKMSIGKLVLAEPFDRLIPQKIKENEIEILQINLTHISEMMRLPLYHRDPFDRLIIAQGISEKIPIVSSDEAFKNYPIDII